MVYAIAIKAAKQLCDSIQIEMNVIVTKNAKSDEEAIEIGMVEAWRIWPSISGYSYHSACAVQIPPDWKDQLD